MTRLLSLLAALSLIAGSAQAQDQRVWRLYNGPDQVTLVYGVPDTDDVAQVLMCAPGHRIQAHFTFEHEVAVRLDGDRWLDARGRAAPWLSITPKEYQTNGHVAPVRAPAGTSPRKKYASTASVRPRTATGPR